MLSGFDFSHWNSDAQVQKYYAQADFVCHKLTEGDYYIDPKAYARASKMFKATDKPVIWYHLVRPDKGLDPIKEAKFFVSQLSYVEAFGPFGIAIDVEQPYVPYNSKQAVLIWLVTIVKEIRKTYNRPVFIYMGDLYPDAWYKELKKAGAEFWICRWRNTAPDHEWAIWQNTERHNSEKLDHDYCNLPLSELWDKCVNSNAEAILEASGMTAEELAQIVVDIIKGKYGNGDERKKALGDKYEACQKILNAIFKEVKK